MKRRHERVGPKKHVLEPIHVHQFFTGFCATKSKSNSSYYVDHFVFAVHQQTALFVLISIYYLLEPLIGYSWAIFILFVLLFPVHLFLALRNFYKQRFIITLFNFGLINIAFFAVGGIFIFLVAIVSFILV